MDFLNKVRVGNIADKVWSSTVDKVKGFSLEQVYLAILI